MEDIRIRISGDPTALDPTINKLKELGAVDKKNADQFSQHHETFKKQAGEQHGLMDRLSHGTERRMEKITEMVAAAFATEKIIEFGAEAVKAFAEAEMGIRKLKFAVTTINGEAVTSFERLNEQAEELAKSLNLLYTPTQIRGVQTQLANFGLTSKMIRDLTPRILDIAKATGKSLPEATEKMILAINGQTKGLRDIGVAFKDTGSKTENFNMLMKDTAKFAGGAADALNTTEGQLQSFGNRWEEFKVSAGEFMTGTADIFVSFLDWIGNGFSTAADEDDRLNKNLKLTKEQMEGIAKFALEQQQLQLSKQAASGLSQVQLDQNAAELKKINEKAFNKEIGELKDEALEKEKKRIEAEIAENKKGKIKMISTNEAISLKSQLSLGDKLEKIEEEQEFRKAKMKDDMTLQGESKAEEALKKRLEKEKAIRLKFEEEMFKRALSEQANLEKSSRLGESPVEKETREYQDRLKAAGIFHKERQDMTDLELKASEALEKDYNEKLKAIDKLTSDQILKQRLEDIDVQTRELQIGLKDQLQKKKITQEKYQLESDNLILAGMQKRLALENEAGVQDVKLEQDIADQKLKIKEDTQKIEEQMQEKALAGIKEFATVATGIYNGMLQSNVDYIDRQLALSKQSIDIEKGLAEAGKENTLDAELKHQSELERMRIQEQRKMIKAKELETFMNAVAEYSKTDPKTAIVKAGLQLAMVKGVEAMYMEEGGLLGDNGPRSLVNFRGFSRKHPGGGDVLIHGQIGEGMLSKRNIETMGGPSAFRSFKSALDNNLIESPVALSNVVFAGLNTKGIEKGLGDLNDTVKNKKEITIDTDGIKNLIVTLVENGIKEVTEHNLRKTRIG